MPTVRAALEELEAGRFVGRQAESEAFARWLDLGRGHPEILQVTGHAGIGKSALLRAFARLAATLGRDPVVHVDGEAISPTPAEFARAVTGEEGMEPAAFFGDRPGLLLIDGTEELAPLTRWLTTALIPSLDQGVRVAVAGRQPVGPMWSTTRSAIRTIELGSLGPDAAAGYLERRGVAPEVAPRILEVAGGYPLALSLAADLAVHRGVARFKEVPEWKLATRSLVDQLLQDAPDLQAMLEAAAVVRQFNEPALAAVAGLEGGGRAFAELCAMSFVRPTRHGLTLHEDVRRVVIEELGWRDPERLALLRRRARAYYRDRIRRRRPGEEWLVSERMYLWESTVHSVYFPGGDLGTMWVEAGGPDDLDVLLEVQADFLAELEAGVPLIGLPPPEECSPEVLRAVVSLPGTEVRIARSLDGRAHGYGFTLPVSRASLALLPRDGAIATLVERGLPADVRRDLPPTWEGSTAAYMSAATVRGERAAEATGALSADWFRLALRGGVLLGCSGHETVRQVSEALGGVRIPEVGTSSVGAPRPLDGYVFDIRRIGPDAWLEAVTRGLPLPPDLSEEEREKELHRVLVAWPDDARLTGSPLAQLALLMPQPDDEASPADMLRTAVRRALEEVRADDEMSLACRALEAAYFERKLAHEAIAERLNVSRTTFYRLLHRAEGAIASRLDGASRS